MNGMCCAFDGLSPRNEACEAAQTELPFAPEFSGNQEIGTIEPACIRSAEPSSGGGNIRKAP